MTEYMVICVGTRLARIRNFRNIEVESHVIQVIRAINGKKKTLWFKRFCKRGRIPAK